ncbi:hypothetical protein PISMIDRAFT_677348, partial [Pisolithus microcarpus 441]
MNPIATIVRCLDCSGYECIRERHTGFLLDCRRRCQIRYCTIDESSRRRRYLTCVNFVVTTPLKGTQIIVIDI